MSKLINIEIVYAKPIKQTIVRMQVTENTTLLQAVIDSDIQNLLAYENWQEVSYAIYSKVIKNPESHCLQADDRIEICRPLTVIKAKKTNRKTN